MINILQKHQHEITFSYSLGITFVPNKEEQHDFSWFRGHIQQYPGFPTPGSMFRFQSCQCLGSIQGGSDETQACVCKASAFTLCTVSLPLAT